jgi:RNA polymerase sigma-70 factor (ECF subfamily)
VEGDVDSSGLNHRPVGWYRCGMDHLGPAHGAAPIEIGAADPEDEAALVAAVVTGDRNALASLYDRHAGRLTSLVMRMLGDVAQAEDLVHDVFVEAWNHAHQFDPSRGTVRAWLTTRARSRALDRLGHRKRGARIFAEAQAHEIGPSSVQGVGGPPHFQAAQFDANLDARILRSSLLDLPDELARVIEGTYYDGLSAAELAGQLGIPVGTIKSRLARAIAHLRQRLAISTVSSPGGDA